MATFRKVHTSFWSDPFTQELTPEQKYFYLYLITNDKTRQCGIYETTKRQMCYDTGYNIDTVSKLLGYFIEMDKIKFNQDTNEIAIKNWSKYNGSTSPKVQSCINQELSNIKDTLLIEYVYSMDTVGIHIRNKNKNKNKNKIQEEEKEEKKIQEDENTKYTIEHCVIVSMNHERWVRANKATAEELETFNKYLEKIGKYEMNPADYKKYFATIKGKFPELVRPITKELTTEDLRKIAAEIDKQNKL